MKKTVVQLNPKVFAAFAQNAAAEEERLVKPQELERAMKNEPNIASYYWVIEYCVPAKMSKTGKQFVNVLTIAGWAPVIRIGHDMAQSKHEIETLKIIFEYHNPEFTFGLSYADKKLLDTNVKTWFEWGDLIWDLVCTECGEITPSPIIVERFICKGCDPFGRNYMVRQSEEILCEKHTAP